MHQGVSRVKPRVGWCIATDDARFVTAANVRAGRT